MRQLLVRGVVTPLMRPRSAVRDSGRRCQSEHLGRRLFHVTATKGAVRPFILADIGEGITECQIVDWFVKVGDKVEQFDRICEAQSDKASVEITSRFDGTITKLHYDSGDIATVGKPLLDVDTDDPIDSETGSETPGSNTKGEVLENQAIRERLETPAQEPEESEVVTRPATQPTPSTSKQNGTQLLSPAVRHQIRTLGIDPSQVPGTGRDGRVTKEDVQRYVDSRVSSPSTETQPSPALDPKTRTREYQVHPLTAIERHMFQTMTQSLAIPQFLYTHSVEVAGLNRLRRLANAAAESAPEPQPRLTTLPLILKTISHTFSRFPRLNAHLDTERDPRNPSLILKSSHNFGIAVDTPQGLLVPVIKNVQDHSTTSLAVEIIRLSELAKAGRLAPDDFRDATFIVSNIGSIGGNVVGPVIVPPMVGIVAVGRSRTVPVFDEDGHVVPREQLMLSWSADHRVIDGATMARCAEAVAGSLENVELLGTVLR